MKSIRLSLGYRLVNNWFGLSIYLSVHRWLNE